jgi:hypothetical protein
MVLHESLVRAAASVHSGDRPTVRNPSVTRHDVQIPGLTAGAGVRTRRRFSRPLASPVSGVGLTDGSRAVHQRRGCGAPGTKGSTPLPGGLHSDLNQAWGPSGRDTAKIGTRPRIPVWRLELRMVPGVEELPTKLQSRGLSRHDEPLLHPNIPIVETRAIEHGRPAITKKSHRWNRKAGGVKPEEPIVVFPDSWLLRPSQTRLGSELRSVLPV